jgi:ABC-type transport system substrate-binding protein
VDIDAVDVSAMGPRLFSGQFDALINAWSTQPSPMSIRGAWYSPPPGRRSINFQAWSNAAFDAALDSAMLTTDEEHRHALFQRAYRAMIEDVPAVWLYESRTFVALNRRIRTVGENADNWWRFLRLWWIPADERITRDTP